MRNLLIIPVLVALAGCGGTPDVAAVRANMASEQLAIGEPVVNSVGIILVPIPSGEFQMGTSDKQAGQRREAPQHLVKLTKPYYLGVCEVTQSQYEAVMGATPWKDKPLAYEGPDYAATYVSWDNAVEFCKKLSEQESHTYRLPTEAEWENACRAGTDTAFSYGDDGKQLGDYGWFSGNAYKAGEQYAHPVGQKLPNGWALHDTHGNVWEWCQDWFGGYGPDKEVTDPLGPKRGRTRVWRGGSFSDDAINARSGTRVSYSRADYRPEYLVGFRVLREMDASSQTVE